jgi:hypothetical protein
MLLVWIFYLLIKEKSINECLDIALKLAALKLQNVGRCQIILTFFLNFYKSVGNNKILVMVLCLMHIRQYWGKI